MQDTYTTPIPAPAQGKSNTMLVIVALGLGLLVALISALYTTNIRKQIALQMKPVWHLRRDKAASDRFNMERDVRMEQMPETALNNMGDVIKDEQTLKNWNGQPFTQFAREGELLRLGMFQEGNRMEDTMISEGNVACALQINGRTAPAGLRPGMFADLVVTISPPGQLPETFKVMEKVRVIGVGSQTDEAGGTARSYSSITVEVRPHEALALVAISSSPQVSSRGFSLLIRNPSHVPSMTGVNPKVLDDLRIEKPKPEAGG